MSGGGASGPSSQVGARGLMMPPPAPVLVPRQAEVQILSALQDMATQIKSQGNQLSSFIEQQNGLNVKFNLDLGYLRNMQSSSSSTNSKRSRQSQQEGSVDEDDGHDSCFGPDDGVSETKSKRACRRDEIARGIVYKNVTLPSLKTATDAVFRFDKYVESCSFPSKIAHYHVGYTRKHTLVKTMTEIDEVFDTVRSTAVHCSAGISARLASSRASAGLR